MARVAGIVFFKVGGKQYSARGSFAYSPLGTSKTGIPGQDGIHGYKEVPCVPFIEGEITDNGQIKAGDWRLLNGSGSPATLELANGKVVTLNNPWLEGEVSVDTVEAKYKVKLSGTSCRETLAS